MGAKISVLIRFSLIQKISDGLSVKKQAFSKQDSLGLYLKKYLMSSQYMDRKGHGNTTLSHRIGVRFNGLNGETQKEDREFKNATIL